MVFNNKVFVYVLAVMVLLTCGCRMQAEEEVGSGQQYTMLTNKGLLAVATPDKDNIWAVGYGAVILHSADGGKTWQHQTSPIEIDLFDVCFTDIENGWIVAKYGIALHTTNGGQDWNKVDTGTTERLFSICFVDRETGWAVGSKGIVIHTADGGSTWTRQEYERSDDPFGDEDDEDINMDVYNAIHAEEGEKLDVPLRSKHDDSTLNQVLFVDRNNGWIAGEYGLILHTTDGGATWVQQECKELIPVVSEEEWEIQAPSLFTIYFETAQRGFAAGLDCSIVVTEDAGATWKKLSTDSKLALYGISVHGDLGCAVGSKGAYYYSRDGGDTWTRGEHSLNTNFWMRDISFSDALNGWIVGSLGTMVQTTDGGKTWNSVSGITIN